MVPSRVRGATVASGLYLDGVRQPDPADLATAMDLARAGDGYVWLGLHEPSADVLDVVATELGLHPLAVEDAVKARQRPKLELYGDSAFLVLKTVHCDGDGDGVHDGLHGTRRDGLDADGQRADVPAVSSGDVMLFHGPHFVVTVRHGPDVGLSQLRTRLELQPRTLALGPGAVVHAVADLVVDGYAVAIDQLADVLDDVELALFSGDRRTDVTSSLYALKRAVLDLRRAARPLVESTAPWWSGDAEALPRLVHSDVAPYLRDVHDHALRSAEQVDGLDELLTGALQSHLAQVAMRQNDDMRKISAWVAIAGVNTLVAGVYGMNFEHMPELGWTYGYPLSLGLMAGLSLLLHRGFHRSGWL